MNPATVTLRQSHDTPESDQAVSMSDQHKEPSRHPEHADADSETRMYKTNPPAGQSPDSQAESETEMRPGSRDHSSSAVDGPTLLKNSNSGPTVTLPGGKDVGQIGPYRILEWVAEGGMGVVYRAEHTTLNRNVALKVMRPDVSENLHFVERFLREAKLAASVEHPNVVTLYDAGTEQGLLFMALKWVPGGTLAQLLRNAGTLGEKRALEIAIDCAKGLEAIHEAGLIHRDIKPANILLSKTGRALIADLGLARAIEKDDGLTMEGTAMGTPSYMAPEQARGKKDIDIRADIYSVGVTIYAMLTGEPPFKGSSVYDTVAKVIYETPINPRKSMPNISEAMDAGVMRCLAKDAADRPQTPEELVDLLQSLQTTLGFRGPQRDASSQISNVPQSSVVSVPLPTPTPTSEISHKPKPKVMFRGAIVESEEPEAPKSPDEISSGVTGMKKWLMGKFKNAKKPGEESSATNINPPSGAVPTPPHSTPSSGVPVVPGEPPKNRVKKVYRGQVYYEDE